MRGFTARNAPYMGLVDRRPVVCRNLAMGFWVPLHYGNPRFSEPGKVLTKVALERSRMVLCSPDWGAHGGNEYW